MSLELIILIPLAPLIGFLINGLLGPRLPKKLVGLIACAAVAVSLTVAVFAFVTLSGMEVRHFEHDYFMWIESPSADSGVVTDYRFSVPFGLQLDPLSLVMALVVTGVGFLIHVYSIGYMWHERGYWRYFAFLNLFTFAMLLLVLANNFLLLFVGWEGVGLCSYLLIGFFYEKPSAAIAGMKAFVVNRIGDVGFALGALLIFFVFGTFDFSEVMMLASQPENQALGTGVMTVIALLLFVGATGKSAQIPLYVWLPDAMEGPTPVSALIHAATMVTAGVYMVVRCNVLFALAPDAMLVVAVIGGMTAIFAATIGLVQNDIKRVLAYSTVSQLGYMFLALGVGAFTAGIFHLMTHAFFKALLFLGAGSVIHAMSGEQDIRKMGALKKKIPVTYWTFAIAAVAIAGIPPLSGFFSKDEILWKTFSSGHTILWGIGFAAAGMTAFYMFRLVYLTFHGESRVDAETAKHIHESPKSMTVPLMVLCFLAIVGGWIGIPHAITAVTHFPAANHFEEWLHPVVEWSEAELAGAHGDTAHHAEPGHAEPAHGAAAHGEAHGAAAGHGHHVDPVEYVLMGLSILIALAGILLAAAWYLRKSDTPKKLAGVLDGGPHRMLLNKYWVDELYDLTVVQRFIWFGNFLWKFIDVIVIDGTVNAVAHISRFFGIVGSRFQTGYVRNYALGIVLGVVILIWACLF